MTVEPSIELLLESNKEFSDYDKLLLRKAYIFAEKAHSGQKRKSGEPYFNHVFATGMNLSLLKMTSTVIAAGLMHDTIEDTIVTSDDIRQEFGEEILSLVEGVTKLGTLKYKGVERHAESLRKFFIAMTNDIRVVIIKIADRLHNVQTLEYHTPEKAKRIAVETLEIHARLADRLGMGRLKAQLEDNAFPYAFPEEYEKVSSLLKETVDMTDEHLEEVSKNLKEELEVLGVEILKMQKRTKHLYSLYEKLKKHHMDISKIYDIIALRIIVKDVGDCYQSLGVIHALYKPLPGRIKDYIAIPKPNGYRSLHTTVFDGKGGTFEVQIRTVEMHKDAEFGVASHLTYKEDGDSHKKVKVTSKTNWTKDLMQMQAEVAEHDEFLKNLKMDFFENRVFVYTPKGDVIELPEDSSPIDFAFAIHTDVGLHIQSSKVNSKMAALDTKLKRGDIVEIITHPKSVPTRRWLDLCKTTMAKKSIKNYLKTNGSALDRLFVK